MKSRLADVADVRAGYPFRGKVVDDPNGSLSVVQMKDINDAGHLDPTGCLHIAEEAAHGKHLLKLGDVLLQSRGSKFPAGMIDAEIRGVAALGLHLLRPGKSVLPEYLAWIMNHPRIRETLGEMARGSYVPFLSVQDLKELKVPLPPIETQR